MTECNGSYRKCIVKHSYTYLMVAHFDWYGGGYLCKHDTTNIHDSLVDM